MSFLRDLSVKTKMIGISLLVVAGALTSGFTFVIINDVGDSRAEMMRDTRTTAAFLGESCAAALAFDQPAGAAEILASLQAIPTILGSSLYDSNGALFSAYQRADGTALPDRLDPGLVTGFEGDLLHVVVPIVFRDEEYGTLYLRASTAVLDEHIKSYLLTMILVMAGMLLLSYVLANALQRTISRPIIALGETALEIAERGDYSVRVHGGGSDEIGMLYGAFNGMIEQVEGREADRDQAEAELRRAEKVLRELNLTLEERVKARTHELQDANDELETFAYSVAHDLRAPLRAIDGFSEILSDEKSNQLDEEGLRLLGVVRDNTRLMAALIEDLLELSRVSRGEMKRTTCDMEAMARAVILDLEQEVTDPTRRVSVGPLPAAIGDPVLVRQVWVNLLSNAFKFSSSGEESAVIEVLGSVDGADRVYSVKDNGVGFDMAYTNKLFNVFERLHDRQEFEGTGIGLSIVKRVVERHGGRVWGEGRVGEGATFHFALPNSGE